MMSEEEARDVVQNFEPQAESLLDQVAHDHESLVRDRNELKKIRFPFPCIGRNQRIGCQYPRNLCDRRKSKRG